MSVNQSPLDQLAARAGILPSYHDLEGTLHVAGAETKSALLKAVGYDISEPALSEQMEAIDARDRVRCLPDYVIVPAGMASTVVLVRPPASGSWSLVLDNGEIMSGDIASDTVADGIIRFGPLPAGYHQLSLGTDEALVIAAPERAPSVQEVARAPRAWGMTGGLYAVRSTRSLGLADYEDLAHLCEVLAEKGAAFLGINPVHALGDACTVYSPYSPTHRGYFNSRHIAVDRVPEFENAQKAHTLLAQNAGSLDALRAIDLIDYDGVNAHHRALLGALFDVFDQGQTTADRTNAFDLFCQAEGARLEEFCLFEALSHVHGSNWRIWPEAVASPDAPGIRELKTHSWRELRYHAYLQWLASTQLLEAKDRAKRAGMALGLYADLAVGVRPDGAEIWANQGAFAHHVSLGAPPDAFNPNGQNWSLAPLNPCGLVEQKFEPFIATIRQCLKHAGMLRIDHVMGLLRCFWVPDDGSPGAYVRYPLDALLAIIKIEAHRHNVVIVGEDLGIVPEGLRETLAKAGFYGCTIMQFEKHDNGDFRSPSDYRPNTLSSVGTHDTPTLRGYWQGKDNDDRLMAGQFDQVTRDEMDRRRGHDRWCLQKISGHWQDSEDRTLSFAQNLAIHRSLASGSAALVAVQLDDVLEVDAQPNMPGTVTEYPNWRLKMPLPIDELSKDPRLTEFAAMLSNDV